MSDMNWSKSRTGMLKLRAGQGQQLLAERARGDCMACKRAVWEASPSCHGRARRHRDQGCARCAHQALTTCRMVLPCRASAVAHPSARTHVWWQQGALGVAGHPAAVCRPVVVRGARQNGLGLGGGGPWRRRPRVPAAHTPLDCGQACGACRLPSHEHAPAKQTPASARPGAGSGRGRATRG